MKFAKSFLWNVSCKFLHRGWQVWAVDQIAAIETVGILESTIPGHVEDLGRGWYFCNGFKFFVCKATAKEVKEWEQRNVI